MIEQRSIMPGEGSLSAEMVLLWRETPHPSEYDADSIDALSHKGRGRSHEHRASAAAPLAHRHRSRMRAPRSMRGPWLATAAPLCTRGQLVRSNSGTRASGMNRVREA